jgi:hypothetical protein
MNDKYTNGFIGTYINDHPFRLLCEIPVEVAVFWVKFKCPASNMSPWCRADYLTVGGNDPNKDALVNGWMNKLFVIADEFNGRWLALYRHDDKFYLYIER